MLDDTAPAPVSPAIAAAAAQLAAAKLAAEATGAKLAEVDEHHGKVRTRLDALGVQRSALATRRAAGNGQPSDAAELGLLDLDREGLTRMLAEASSAVATARQAHEAAQMAVSVKQAALTAAEEEALLTALVQHAGKLGDSLQETITRLHTLRLKLHKSADPWGPSGELQRVLRRAAASRGELA